MKAEKPEDKQFKEAEDLIRKALASSEAKHETEIKKLWEYFRKQMARKQMKLAEKDNQTIMLERRIGELEEYIEQLKKENEETFADIIHEGHIKGIINRQVNQALSELRDEIVQLKNKWDARWAVGLRQGDLWDDVLKAINSRRTA